MGPKIVLTCDEVQHKNKDYILRKLPPNEAYGYVRHIRGCRKCRDELEEYYAFFAALNLDVVSEGDSNNFFLSVEKRLEQTEAQESEEKKEHRRRILTYVAIALFVAAATGVTFGT